MQLKNTLYKNENVVILKTNRATVKVYKLCELKRFLGKLEVFDLYNKDYLSSPIATAKKKETRLGLRNAISLSEIVGLHLEGILRLKIIG